MILSMHVSSCVIIILMHTLLLAGIIIHKSIMLNSNLFVATLLHRHSYDWLNTPPQQGRKDCMKSLKSIHIGG